MSELCITFQYTYWFKKLTHAKYVMTALNPNGRHGKLASAVHILQNACNFVISHCCFAEYSKELYKVSKHTYRGIVLLIKPFVW